jgi:signal transduction histidine kinase
MAWQFSVLHVPLVLAVVVATWLAAFAWRRRSVPGCRPLAVMLSAVVLWTASYAVELATTQWWLATGVGGVIMVSGTVAPFAWLWFALEYAGYPRWLDRRVLYAAALVPLATAVLVPTNGAHGLVHAGFEASTVGGVRDLQLVPRVWYRVAVGYAYLTLLAGAVLLVRVVLAGDGVHRGQASVLVLAVLAPGSLDVLDTLGVYEPGLDPTPFAFLVSGVLLSVAVFRHELLQSVPLARSVARDELVDRLDQAVLTLDAEGIVLDRNPAAREVFGTDPTDEPLTAHLDGLGDRLGDEEATFTVSRTDGGAPRHYDVRVTPRSRGDVRTGFLVSVADVTDRERREQRLTVFSRVLRHDIRTDMNVIMAHADRLEVAGGIAPDAEDEAETPAGTARAATAIRARASAVVEVSDRARLLERTLGEGSRRDVDLVPEVEDVLDSLAGEFPDAEVETDLPDRLAVTTNGLLTVAVEELCRNAVEHGTGSITLSATVEGGTDRVRLAVLDDGPGIPAHERAVLETGTETPLDHSSGTGLWLVSWVLTDLGGTVDIADADGGGTRVTLDLPAPE